MTKNLIAKLALSLAVVAMPLAGCSYEQPAQSTVLDTEIDEEQITSENLCITETTGYGPGGITLTALECKTTQELSTWLTGYSVYLGTVAALCGLAPEPLVTKGSMALLAAGSAVSGGASFVLQNMPCEGEVELSPAAERRIVRLICEKSGKTYKEDAGPDGEPGCID